MFVDNQQGDVRLFHTIDNGEISVTDGIVAMDGGLETSAYLSLFGGNFQDAGASDTSKQYWGNLLETEEPKKLRSKFQYLLSRLPITSSNLIKLEDAAKSDLQWFLDSKVASSVEVVISVPALNTIQVNVTIDAFGKKSEFEFTENWENMELTIADPPAAAIPTPPPVSPSFDAEWWAENSTINGSSMVTLVTEPNGYDATPDSAIIEWVDNQINGYPIWRFTGSTSKFMYAHAWAAQMQGIDIPHVVYMVYSPSSSTNGCLFDLWNFPNNNTYYARTTNTNDYYMEKQNDDMSQLVLSPGGGTSGYRILKVKFTYSSPDEIGELYENGVQIATLSQSSTFGKQITPTDFRFGRRRDGAFPLDADYAGLAFLKDLNLESQADAWLAYKYNL